MKFTLKDQNFDYNYENVTFCEHNYAEQCEY